MKAMHGSVSGALPGLAAGALILCMAAPSYAFDVNGFMPAPGEGDVAISYTTEGYDHFWAGEEKVSPPEVGEVETNSLSVWFQYGFTDRVALVANLPYVEVSSDGTQSAAGNPDFVDKDDLQDLSALVKVRLLSSGGGGAAKHSLLGAVGVRTPASSYEANAPVDIGDGTTDALLRLVYQVEAGAFYFSQQVGYDLRGDDAPDGYPLYTELGYTFGRVTVNGFLSVLVADDGTDIGDPGFTFPSNREEYQRVGAKVYARLGDRVGLSVSGFDALDGRNTGDASGLSAGLNFRF
jgi:hypothetical protein